MDSAETFEPSAPPTYFRPEAPSRALTVIAIIMVAAVVAYLGPILKPLLIAILAFFIVRWAVRALAGLGIPTWLSYMVLFAVVIVSITGFAFYVQGELKVFQRRWETTYRDAISIHLVQYTGKLPELDESLTIWSKDVFSYALHTGMDLVQLLGLVFFYLLFLLIGAGKMPRRVSRAFSPERAEHILSVIANISAGMEAYMKTKTIVGAGMALTTGIILRMFGIDHWPLWAAIAFALNYVTYIGSLLAIGPPVVLSLLQFSDRPWIALILVALLLANRSVWIDFVEIRMLGRSLNIDPVILFLWLAYWAWVWGVLGLILAFPMVTALKIILRSMKSTRHWTELMGEE